MEYIITNVILPLIVGGVGAFAYPRIEAYLQNRSLSGREEKIKSLLIRYAEIKYEVENPDIGLRGMPVPRYYIIFPLLSIALVVLSLELLPEFSWLRFLLLFIVSIPMYYATVMISKGMSVHTAYLKDIVNFDSFKGRTIKELKKLGGNPEDLDKEETAG